MKNCLWCNAEFTPIKSNHKYCSVKCREKYNQNILDRDSFMIFNRDKFRCIYCGKSSINDETIILHLDHVVPYSLGGPDQAYNLVTSCGQCNIAKQNIDFNDELKKEILQEI
jgi:5-methylcytosine-specific restriction endonuclease McrA